MKQTIKVALVGNPNTGKSSLFNVLTGLNQKVANYPGITVEKKIGRCKLNHTCNADIIDLPGTYSLNANSIDERVAVGSLLNRNNPYFPDVVVAVTDVENLKHNLLIFTQIKDLKIPTILVVNMADQMAKKGISLNVEVLQERLNTRVILTSTHTKQGIEELKEAIANYKTLTRTPCLNINNLDVAYFENLAQKFPKENAYKLWLIISHNVDIVEASKEIDLSGWANTKSDSEIKRMKQRETILRYQFINTVLKETYVVDASKAKNLRALLDKILMHKIFGYVIFILILLLIFQAIFEWSSVPMAWIEQQFSSFAEWVATTLPKGVFNELISQGVIPGIGGVAIFIPQIAILFLFVSILEETGYMSRVVFLMDNMMRRFGLSGKSVVPLISGVACAIPAVMVARNIESWKERLITILVTPFMTCSARLPVYLIIIALVIPQGYIFGLSYQALTMFGLYLLGFLAALTSAFILDKTLKIRKNKSFFIAEMPNYKTPQLRNITITVFEKTKSFVLGAGKIILAISIIIWFLGSHGMGEKYRAAESQAQILSTQNHWTEDQTQHFLESYKLEHSFLGNLGKGIEPIFSPLGYDWKISIGVLSSFAAREVFVGTLATVYSLGSDLDTEEEEGKNTILARMKEEKHPNGVPIYTLASGISLLLFYAFAMQCLSTLAVVRRETNSWKWTAFQWFFMGGLAYISAMFAFMIIK
ncbi:ferrous iron transport protein B [Capnocytophaga canimorsus]|uniref:ferrous iron transport protein B n=1 Tax=Capnocytophaga canimorsus TaxID=28188 RepID=UPI0037D97C5B